MTSASGSGGQGSSLEGLPAELRRLADEIDDALGAGVAAFSQSGWRGGLADRLRTGADERRARGRNQADHLRSIASRIDAVRGAQQPEGPGGAPVRGPGEGPSPERPGGPGEGRA